LIFIEVVVLINKKLKIDDQHESFRCEIVGIDGQNQLFTLCSRRRYSFFVKVLSLLFDFDVVLFQ